jgi:hypothetical protein
MKLRRVSNLLSVLRNAEEYRVKPDGDFGSCQIGDGIFMKTGGRDDLLVVAAIYYQGNISKRQELSVMLQYLRETMPDENFYYTDGWID